MPVWVPRGAVHAQGDRGARSTQADVFGRVRGRFVGFAGLGLLGGGSCPGGTAGRDRHTTDAFGQVRAYGTIKS